MTGTPERIVQIRMVEEARVDLNKLIELNPCVDYGIIEIDE